MVRSDRNLWWSWIAANAIAEGIGLGGAFVLGDAVLSADGEPTGRAAMLGVAALVVAVGTLEGVIVGLAQGLVLRQRLPLVSLASWTAATAAGACAAWMLGMLPSVTMGLSQSAAASPAAEIPDYLNFVFAVFLGAVAGPILAGAQWLVLRRHVETAWRWIPANAAAWMLAMPVVFVAPMLAHDAMAGAAKVALFLSTTASAGAIVGAVHGAVLVRFRPIVPPCRA